MTGIQFGYNPVQECADFRRTVERRKRFDFGGWPAVLPAAHPPQFGCFFRVGVKETQATFGCSGSTLLAILGGTTTAIFHEISFRTSGGRSSGPSILCLCQSICVKGSAFR